MKERWSDSEKRDKRGAKVLENYPLNMYFIAVPLSESREQACLHFRGVA